MTAEHAARLAAQLGDGVIGPAPEAWLSEPRGRIRGHPGSFAARPRSPREVARILAFCQSERIPVVPRAGGTGLVGGQLAPETIPAPLILSVERMTAVRSVDPVGRLMTVEAGAILAEVQRAAAEAGLLFPLSLAAEGSARIGGNLATNAGGVQVLRYGTARELCLGLEAVLPDGRLWNGLTRLRKDNTGYDLRDLLIGAEGTLGVITAATLRLFPAPRERWTALVAVADPAAALRLLAAADEAFDGRVTACELIHRTGFDFIAETLPLGAPPLRPVPEWSVLIEAASARRDALAGPAEELMDRALREGLIADGVVAASEAQRAQLWRWRESIPEANRRIGAIASHDISLPLAELPGFIAEAPARLRAAAELRINCFGHLGDGNLHYNLFPAPGRRREDYAAEAEALSEIVNDLVCARGGSISAEHGIGRLRRASWARRVDPVRRAAMAAIKRALDPAGIMNPGVFFDPGDPADPTA
ncbi:MAG: FAD-binding oxidoreductase [Alphaproteobacteria bacterium]|nr:MAG: FAD-binding oxidoreductase [Alphaproteobacteria bacterium]